MPALRTELTTTPFGLPIDIAQEARRPVKGTAGLLLCRPQAMGVGSMPQTFA